MIALGGMMMQTKKEDIRQMILDTSTKEFINKGYDDTSMRVIAKKANTTVGNMYHYFPSKEAILDEILQSAIQDLNALLEQHFYQNNHIESREELMSMINNDLFDNFQIHFLLKKELIILFKIKSGKYKEYRDHFMDAFQQHIAWHLKIKDKDDYFVKVICQAVIECIITLMRTSKNYEQARKEFLRFFRLIANGLVIDKDH